jgi:glycerol-3-phosphate dehydrogenase (NAD(P)+)
MQEIRTILINQHGNVSSILDYCGIGDIYLTCLHTDSRNFIFGHNVAQHGMKEAININKSNNVEGLQAFTDTKNILYNQKNKTDIILLKAVYEILFKGGNAQKLIPEIFAKI